MKLFKKALVATAVVGAFGAQAATISSDALKVSSEGIAAKVASSASKVSFDIVVDKEHPSSSVITLSFDKNVDLMSTLACTGTVTQTVSGGKAFCGSIGFDYGTGSFTFDNVTVKNGDASKGETDSISFKVNLGNPLTANSAFRVVLGQHDFDANTTGTDTVHVLGASTLSYKSEKADKTVIETGTGVLAVEANQFAFDVTTKLDGVIERNDATAWKTTGSVAGNEVDELKYTFTNKSTLLRAIAVNSVVANFAGNFKNVDNFADGATSGLASVKGTVTTSATAPSTDADKVIVTFANTNYTGEQKDTLSFTNKVNNANPAVKQSIPVTGDVTGSVVITGTNATLPAGGLTVESGVDAGKWVIDATIINVPYVPVNYEDTDTFIHFANETSKEVDVIVTAIDQNGVEYGPLNYGKLAANTVTKLPEPKMDEIFKLNGAKTKLSVTFNIDANKGDVTAYAVSQNSKGRTEISTSQQRGN
ncbi:hypothetical protein [Pseudoalteromonas sp. M8]|uniref:hypothetical protein n=1 Tax=Pseudoalteromonas sp. M8 TaxID=2692624 RepID=UPI001BA50B4C|nr:hypothetical protein [Pseudoalteromonas sp. M8]QUI69716.1 hypothetical protein GSF13_07890 [Pseudoalteromonas sp. M8]